jgi:hypothetical protein
MNSFKSVLTIVRGDLYVMDVTKLGSSVMMSLSLVLKKNDEFGGGG